MGKVTSHINSSEMLASIDLINQSRGVNADIASLSSQMADIMSYPVRASQAPFNLLANGLDNSTILQQIFNYLRDNPRKKVVLPKGDYISNVSLTAYAGSGTLDLNGSSIDFSGLTSGYAISIIPSSDDSYSSILMPIVNGVIKKNKK